MRVFFICLIATTAFSQNDFSDVSSFKLYGNVQSVDICVLSYTLQQNNNHQAINTDTVGHARYEFSKNGDLIFMYDTIPNVYKPNSSSHLDSSNYLITNDPLSSYQIATKKKADTTDEFEVRFRQYNELGLLETDSTVYGKYIDSRFTQGPIVTKYLYDDHGNVIYVWFKSSYVFAIRDHWVFIYEYDAMGNWIKMSRNYVSTNSSLPLKLIDLKNAPSVQDWAVLREIKYY